MSDTSKSQKEFNLKSKVYWESNGAVIHEEDVKEFIRLLKEKTTVNIHRLIDELSGLGDE